MTLDSSNETVAILYDIENAPFEMLNYTLGKARRYQPCRTIVVSDWDSTPEQKRWEKLLRRPGFTFRQISRTFFGKNSLDSALYDSAQILYQEGVRRYFIITTDSDFVRIAELLNSQEKSYIIGVGTKQASETLRNAYDEFIVYPPEENIKVKKGTKSIMEQAKENVATKGKTVKKPKPVKKESAAIAEKKAENKKAKAAAANPQKKSTSVKKEEASTGELIVRLPKTLRSSLVTRMEEEGVSMNELITYLLMRGLSK
ncbi:NYN domain-containing protein [Mitsuokella sp. oral taxon 131]|mgnify:FL=1|uniref:NYN domain-containing protein n=1 Tax=Mitsuokella sp. oral taxon 131 TaxID=1321780 RepID=UPI0003AE0523|nr:NYN domain-containing protein [Mitsuokella sp. oral taxon 131]ERL05145.1 hypothetical protein HMPREF1985_00898 [Mitsuokella sp. oral taxon 131 str. W9106]